MASMKYCDKHNQVGFLKKPEESTGFAEITVTVITLDNGEQDLTSKFGYHDYTFSDSHIVENKLQPQTDEKCSKSGGWDQFGSKLAKCANLGFAGVNRPLLANMIAGHDDNQGEPQEEPIESQPPPNASVNTVSFSS
ncbi:hypothetical protein Tco_1096448 [Tanacetum coccineum]